VIGAYLQTHAGDFEAFEAKIREVLAKGLVAQMRRNIFGVLGMKIISAFVFVGTVAICAASVNLFLKIIRPVIPHFLSVKLERLRIPGPFQRFASRTTLLEAALDDLLFNGISLCDISLKPSLVINATELRTGSAFRFSANESGSWRWGKIHNPNVSVAHAVAASAAYPLFLPAFDQTFTFEKNGELTLGRVVLTDGGVYDNLGLGCLWPDRSQDISLNVIPVDTIICCSAGYGLRHDPPSQFLFARMTNVFSTIFDRAQNASMHRLHEAKQFGKIKHFILPYLGQQDRELPNLPANFVRRERVYSYPTDFNPMTEEWMERLISRGEQLTMCLARTYLSHLVSER
jgi:NTE family protein